MNAKKLPLTDAKTPRGTGMHDTVPASPDDCLIDLFGGVRIITQDVIGITKYNHAMWEFTLPPDYTDGAAITASFHVDLAGIGVLGTATLSVQAEEITGTGTLTAIAVTPALRNIVAAGSNLAFTLTGTGLVRGDRIKLLATIGVQETGGTDALVGRIRSAWLV